jgi:4-methyl-5(b-hydroxyethyl)-thiazole monophosphate biosynthesis
LDAAGVLQGRSFTSFPGTQDELPDRDQERKLVRDGHVITSQGAGTATLFALALVEALCGEAKGKEIAASICF